MCSNAEDLIEIIGLVWVVVKNILFWWKSWKVAQLVGW